jgi:hypothetical protein
MKAYPEHYEHQFTTHVMFFGMETPVLCAFNDPDVVKVWLRDSDEEITYKISAKEGNRIEAIANEILENV